jgi:hypothetical protein
MLARRKRERDEEEAMITIVDIHNSINPVFSTLQTGPVVHPKDRPIVSDSGATRHMFADKDLFSDYSECKNHFVRVADGKVLPVLGVGSVGPLQRVLHVPGIVYHLTSESELDREGKWCITGRGVKTFYNPTSGGKANRGSVFLVAKLSEKGLYMVNPMHLNMSNTNYNYGCYDALASKTEAIDLLHKTLGHVSVDRLQDIVKTGQCSWSHESPPVNFRKYSSPCVACSLAKSKRRSHVKRIRIPTEPGSLVYVDVWGPNETSSLLNANVYTIGFIDATSKRA